MMVPKIIREIIRIDESKCNGCGICVPACAEGALQVIDGKAKLINDAYCDGLGACLGECPQGAITIEKRVAEEFNEETVKYTLEKDNRSVEKLKASCPSAIVTQSEKHKPIGATTEELTTQQSMLSHWPVQLTLVSPGASFLQRADLVLAADCAPFAYARFHQDFIKEHTVLVACPKLDDFQSHLKKLTEILSNSSVKSLAIIHMEVPCCSGLIHMAKQAIQLAGKDIPLNEITIGVKGDLKLQ